ncbi:outer membrane beta-barrel protein [Maritalea sp.]|uniref:outer membrane beta-barrel protein n=1 Tax=Maritalea sp. TaxID=2003361 RepID=UPI0039E30FCE
MPIISKAILRRTYVMSALCAGFLYSSATYAQEIFGGWDAESAISLRGGFENVDGASSYLLSIDPEFSLQRQEDDLLVGLSGNASVDKIGADQFAARSLVLESNLGLRLNQNAQLDFGLNYGVSQPRTTDPDLPDDVKVGGHQQQFGITGGYTQQFSKTAVQLRGAVGRSQSAASLLNDDTYQSNADQNAWNYGLGARLSRELTPIVSAFVDVQLSRSRYDTGSAILGASRNNWSYEAQIGATADFDERLRGDISVGQLRQTFDDASLAAVQTFTYNANLEWQATQTASVNLSVNTSVSPTSVAGEAMQIVNVGRVAFNQQVNSRVQFSVFGELERQRYQSSADQIRTSGAGFGLTYQANKQLSAFANYSFALRQEPTTVSRTHKIEAGLRFNRQ